MAPTPVADAGAAADGAGDHLPRPGPSLGRDTSLTGSADHGHRRQPGLWVVANDNPQAAGIGRMVGRCYSPTAAAAFSRNSDPSRI